MGGKSTSLHVDLGPLRDPLAKVIARHPTLRTASAYIRQAVQEKLEREQERELASLRRGEF